MSGNRTSPVLGLRRFDLESKVRQKHRSSFTHWGIKISALRFTADPFDQSISVVSAVNSIGTKALSKDTSSVQCSLSVAPEDKNAGDARGTSGMGTLSASFH